MARRLLAAAATALAGLAAAADGDYESSTGRAGFGAWLVHPPLSVQARDDLAPGQGLLVVFVRPGSTAARLGLQPGDVVTDLNGTAVSSRREVRAIVRASLPGDAVTVGLAADTGRREVDGEFVQRLPRMPGANPWRAGWRPEDWQGGPPPWSDAVVEQQRRQLADEAALYAALAADLARARDALAAGDGRATPWSLRFACGYALGNEPEPIGQAVLSGDIAAATPAEDAAGAPAWRFRFPAPRTETF